MIIQTKKKVWNPTELSLSPPFLSIFLAETRPSSEAQFDQTVDGFEILNEIKHIVLFYQ
jgi:hypothetical protein